MTTLHTVNKHTDCLQSCLDLVTAEDAVLLIEDGVYAALESSDNLVFWEEVPTLSYYALADDLAARGLSDKLLAGFKAITWQEFVDLTLAYDKVVSWG